MKKQNFFLAHKQFTLFFILALVIVGVAVFAPWIAPKDPLEAVMVDSLKAPCADTSFTVKRNGPLSSISWIA